MRIIKPSTVRAYATAHRNAGHALQRWMELAKATEWHSLDDVRDVFASADEVKVRSGRTVVVFNIGGNKYRLITAIHYNMRVVYILRFLTHRQYDTEQWKREL